MATSPTDSQIEEVFASASARAFAFLERQWSFRHCGILQTHLNELRDRETRSRYRSDRVVVDIALTYAESGLFVSAWRIPSGAPSGSCWDLRPAGIVNLDYFLKDRFGQDMPPLFSDHPRIVYLTDLLNAQVRRYMRIVVPRLAEAIEATAARLEKYGGDLLSGHPAVFPEPAKPGRQWKGPHRR
jgi:hypothetical protein